jgi:hypothetical protein
MAPSPETCGRLDRPAFDQVQIIVSGRARQPARHKPHRAQHPYALANHVEHPLSVSLREDAVLGQIDHWLALEFVPRRIAETIHDLAAAQDHATTARIDDGGEAERLIAECDRKLAQYRTALDTGANPVTVCRLDRRDRSRESQLPAQHPPRGAASPHDRSRDQGNRGQDLRLTYHPGRRLVEASVAPLGHGFFDGVRGPTAIKSLSGAPILTSEFAL